MRQMGKCRTLERHPNVLSQQNRPLECCKRFKKKTVGWVAMFTSTSGRRFAFCSQPKRWGTIVEHAHVTNSCTPTCSTQRWRRLELDDQMMQSRGYTYGAHRSRVCNRAGGTALGVHRSLLQLHRNPKQANVSRLGGSSSGPSTVPGLPSISVIPGM